MSRPEERQYNDLRNYLHEVIFEAETPAGRWFDIVLLLFILGSVITVMLESVPSYNLRYGNLFYYLEWAFTIVFTIEYLLRIYITYKPIKYMISFFGIIDLLSILPTFLSIFIAGTQSLLVIRGLRLLRIFRIFKLANFLVEGQVIISSLKASRAKISVFISFVLVMVCIFGSIMYLVEGSQNTAFDSIPRSIYWAIVTLTTVGYGDISPITPFGQMIAAFIMISGYAVIAVPTGIVTAEAIAKMRINKKVSTEACKFCSAEGHDEDAVYCKYCGERLNPSV